MNIQELKLKSSEQLITQAEELGIENASTLRKQEILFAILKIVYVFFVYFLSVILFPYYKHYKLDEQRNVMMEMFDYMRIHWDKKKYFNQTYLIRNHTGQEYINYYVFCNRFR
mgnify:CR=1 FL=1